MLEGWARVHSHTTWHYFRAGWSLCGRWQHPRHPTPRGSITVTIRPDAQLGPPDVLNWQCDTCRRRLLSGYQRRAARGRVGQ